MTRRNFFIRSVATVSGDIAVGYAMASACIWIIQSAALGLFLSFLLWLLAIVLSLALSQYALHPFVAVLLSDRKLDQGLTLSVETVRSAVVAATTLWGYMKDYGFDPRSFAKTA